MKQEYHLLENYDWVGIFEIIGEEDCKFSGKLVWDKIDGITLTMLLTEREAQTFSKLKKSFDIKGYSFLDNNKYLVYLINCYNTNTNNNCVLGSAISVEVIKAQYLLLSNPSHDYFNKGKLQDFSSCKVEFINLEEFCALRVKEPKKELLSFQLDEKLKVSFCVNQTHSCLERIYFALIDKSNIELDIVIDISDVNQGICKLRNMLSVFLGKTSYVKKIVLKCGSKPIDCFVNVNFITNNNKIAFLKEDYQQKWNIKQNNPVNINTLEDNDYKQIVKEFFCIHKNNFKLIETLLDSISTQTVYFYDARSRLVMLMSVIGELGCSPKDIVDKFSTKEIWQAFINILKDPVSDKCGCNLESAWKESNKSDKSAQFMGVFLSWLRATIIHNNKEDPKDELKSKFKKKSIKVLDSYLDYWVINKDIIIHNMNIILYILLMCILFDKIGFCKDSLVEITKRLLHSKYGTYKCDDKIGIIFSKM